MAIDPEITWDEAVADELLARAGAEAVSIAADRITEESSAMTGVLSTRPPSHKEWYYSLPAGRLKLSIHRVLGIDSISVYADVKAGLPLARFRNLGGRGRAAYGTRGDWRTIYRATLNQLGRPIP